MTANHGSRWQGVALLLLAAAFTYDSRARDVDTRTRAVQGCERGRVDRSVQRAGWRTAELARRASAADPAQAAARAENMRAAGGYASLVADLTTRISPPFACQKAYPKVQFLGATLGPDVPVSRVRELPSS